MEVEELKTIVENGFREMAARMQEGFAQVDARFEQVDARLDGMDARFEQVDARFEQMDSRFEQMEARFEQVDTRLATLTEDVHLTRVLVEQLNDDMKQISEGVEMHHAELQRHIADNDRRFDQIESVVRNYRDIRR